MVEQYKESHYDDDLTLDSGGYDDPFDASDVDLFEFTGTSETPISRLKSLILSIDWEITDEVLLQFNEEIVELKDIWATNQINLVYLQALEKISKYIYKEKANAHPNAIKMLLSLFYNLEKQINSEDTWSAEEKRKQLIDDVRSFEKLKKQIQRKEAGHQPTPAAKQSVPVKTAQESPDSVTDDQPATLQGLKAAILALDWEITDKELSTLRNEVLKLEDRYSDSQTKLLFLQGIGTLSAYIRTKRSNAHIEAFTLLHSFYDGLEKIASTPLSPAEEKAILLPEVAKFNAFKEMIAVTLSPESMVKDTDQEDDEEEDALSTGPIAPAFADVPEEVKGFQEDEEAASIGLRSSSLSTDISKFFEEDDEKPSQQAPTGSVSADKEIQEAESFSNSFFDAPSVPATEIPKIDPAIALQGVAVETDADDDSAEEALPMFNGALAPALMDKKNEALLAVSQEEQSNLDKIPDEIQGRLDNFFGQNPAPESALPQGSSDLEKFPAVTETKALQGVDVEVDDDEIDEIQADNVPIASTSSLEHETDLLPAFTVSDDEEQVFAIVDEDQPEDITEDSLAPALVAAEDEMTFTLEEEVDNEQNLVDEEPIPALSFLDESLEQHKEFSFEEIASIEDEEVELASEEMDLQEFSTEDESALFSQPEPALSFADESEQSLFSDDTTVELDTAESTFSTHEDESSFLEFLPSEESDQSIFHPSSSETFAFSPEADQISLAEFEVTTDVSEDSRVDEPIGTAELEDISPALENHFEPASDLSQSQELHTPLSTSASILPVETVATNLLHDQVPVSESTDTALARLGNLINQLEQDDHKTLAPELFQELNLLRYRYATRPVIKMYLHFISLITQHIERQPHVDNDALAFLKTIFTSLQDKQLLSTAGNLDLLLFDTVSVMDWQTKSHQSVELASQTSVQPLIAEEHDRQAIPSAHDGQVSLNAIREELNMLQHTLLEELSEIKAHLKNH